MIDFLNAFCQAFINFNKYTVIFSKVKATLKKIEKGFE